MYIFKVFDLGYSSNAQTKRMYLCKLSSWLLEFTYNF